LANQYTAELENSGWDIKELHNSSGYMYGIKSTNGPLTVISFKGTDDIKSLFCGLNAVPLPTKHIYPEFEEDVVHKGFFEYYAHLGAHEHFSKVDEDEFLVFSGHSLGGVACNLAAMDLIRMKMRKPNNYPHTFCSIFTLGAPALLGKNLRRVLNDNFRGSSHIRVFFDNDSAVQHILEANGEPLKVCHIKENTCIYKHGGDGHEIVGSGIFSHKCNTYISNLSTLKNRFWRDWSDFNEEPLYYEYGNQIYFKASNEFLLRSYRSIEFSETAKKRLRTYLSDIFWDYSRDASYSSPYRPIRCADTLFYQVWREENLSRISDLDIIKILESLDDKYGFLLQSYRKNSFLYFERFLKIHGVDIQKLEEMTYDFIQSSGIIEDIKEDEEYQKLERRIIECKGYAEKMKILSQYQSFYASKKSRAFFSQPNEEQNSKKPIARFLYDYIKKKNSEDSTS